MIGTIVIKPHSDGKWTAFHEEKRIGGSKCKSCVIKTMLNLTKNSIKYTNIVIVAENGEVLNEYLTGAANVRKSPES